MSPSEDPVALVQAAGRDHVPVNPMLTSASESDTKEQSKGMIIPGPQDRPTIDSVISEIKEQEWYKEQIVERRTIAPKDAQIGK
jgi:DEAD/DEAH box helicase domain-containing protein